MQIDLSFKGPQQTIDAFVKCLTPENNTFVILDEEGHGNLIIKIRNVKLSSIYSLTDEFLKVYEIVEKIFEDHS